MVSLASFGGFAPSLSHLASLQHFWHIPPPHFQIFCIFSDRLTTDTGNASLWTSGELIPHMSCFYMKY